MVILLNINRSSINDVAIYSMKQTTVQDMESEDFLIYLGPNMRNEDRDRLQDTIVGLNGVESAQFRDDQKLELVVIYNPDKTDSTFISETVRRWNLDAL